jgi:hypothetical protein
MKNLNYGDRDSVGFFQMRMTVWNNGDYAGYAKRPELQVKWFLDHAEAVKAQRVARGQPIDAKHYGDWIADVERPAAQYRGRYQLQLDEARQLLDDAPHAAGGGHNNDARVLDVVRPDQVHQGKVLTTTYGGVTEHVRIGALPHVVDGYDVTRLHGLVEFDRKPVAGWIAPILQYARDHGWKGSVNEGFRTDRQQAGIYRSGVRPAALPVSMGGGGSNHSGEDYPAGAVDVSDAQQLSNIVNRSKYRGLLVWAGAKDPPHFSHPHNGSY